ncbi:MAG: hypothetical protein LBB62_01720 [Proteiniphilum sp.]|nr:hypothetical protein [Proteiniphilum sp.]
MGLDAIKLELIEWLIGLEDEDMISYLKAVKESETRHNDYWNDLTDELKAGIERGLKDIDERKTVSHEEVNLIK